MTDPFATLTLLLEQAETQRDTAIAALQRADAAARAARAQADDLAAYRQQYRQRWGQRFEQAAGVPLVQCFNGFGGRLDQAIDQQQAMAAQAAVRADEARQALVQREQRVALVRALVDRRRAELQRQQDRRDQRDGDELAQRLALYPAIQAAPAAPH
ncbi:MAG: flagellar export protein FliJ [Aquabacterium sp.]